jgi:anti-anti-sigma factor
MAGWVHVAGDLDLAAAPQLMEALRDLEQEACLIVLDLREIAFLDAAGVHVIVDASIAARRDGHRLLFDGHRLLLVGASAGVQRVFALTGTSHQVEVGAGDDPRELPVQAFLQRARWSIAA